MANESKNQTAWLSLFDKYDILNQINKNNLFSIKAEQINEYRESRLMTKFDNTNQLPEIFSNNNIGILPTSRGSYVLGKFNIFHKFESISDVVDHHPYTNIYESMDFNNISSESMAINCAYISKILDDFVGEPLVATVSGRMGSNSFEFSLNNSSAHKIKVDKAQIEIDGGFEGERYFVLIEAKNYISDDFIIRQLYYPYRKWQSSIQKQVRNIYLTYSNGIFELREYAFASLEGYNSINLTRSKRYAIYNTVINIEIIQEIIKKANIEPEPTNVPFPQADSFERVINLCELISASEFLSKKEITENYDFDSRQTDYYLNASKYLGLTETKSINSVACGVLTPKGKALFENDINTRRLQIIELILAKKAFRETLIQFFNKATMPSKNEIVEIMKQAKLNNVSTDITYNRRASTVLGWVNWIVDQIEE